MLVNRFSLVVVILVLICTLTLRQRKSFFLKPRNSCSPLVPIYGISNHNMGRLSLVSVSFLSSLSKCRKRTFTGQYTHFDSFVPWKHRIAWIRSLLSRIHKICSPTKLSQELQFVKENCFLEWLSQTCCLTCLFTNKTLQTTPIYKQRGQQQDRNQ